MTIRPIKLVRRSRHESVRYYLNQIEEIVTNGADVDAAARALIYSFCKSVEVIVDELKDPNRA